jgi:hypothetical protein
MAAVSGITVKRVIFCSFENVFAVNSTALIAFSESSSATNILLTAVTSFKYLNHRFLNKLGSDIIRPLRLSLET